MAQAPTPFQSVRFGSYILVSQLGRGGMAEVFKARSGGIQGFEKVVCVKRILRQHCQDPHFVEMFVNEAKISAKLNHPNIVQVHELGQAEGDYFMAMEFVHGRDLLRVTRSPVLGGLPPPPAVGAYIAREMCRALACAHDFVDDQGRPHPIIHRDVSPQNVMISYDGIVKLCDFGIAKALQQQGMEETRTGALKGKFAYMAPEQLDGQKASAVTDVFAVGVVLFEMLTGQRLFKGNTEYDTLIRVKTQPIPPPSTINTHVQPELDRIVAQALERNPAARYQRAAQMARELEQLLGRVGFTSEDMKEFMRHCFPTREEVPDGVALPQPALSMSGVPAPKTPTPSGAGEKTPVPQRPRRSPLVPILAATGGLAVVGGLLGAVLWRGGGTPAPTAVVAAAPAVVTAKPTRDEATVVAVQLSSNPPGAEVLDGPKLLGTTPLLVKLPTAEGRLSLRLAKPGYDDVTYEVTAADVPALTLKLARRKGPSATARGPSGDPAKVKNVEDDQGLNVKAIDE